MDEEAKEHDRPDPPAPQPERQFAANDGGGNGENLIVTFFAAIGSVVIGIIELVVGIVRFVLRFVVGMLRSPVATLRDTRRTIITSARDAKRNGGALYREFVETVPRPLQLLLLVVSVAFVFVVANHRALAAKRKSPLDITRGRMKLGDRQAYQQHLRDELDQYTLAPVTEPPKPAWQRAWDYVHGTTPAPAPTPAQTEKARWKFDESSNQWRWVTGEEPATESNRLANDGGDFGYGVSNNNLELVEGGNAPPAYDSPVGDDVAAWGSTRQPPAGGDYGYDENPAPPRRRQRRKPVPLDDDDLNGAIDATVKSDMEEAEQIKRKIESMKERDKLSDLRATLGELYQRRKLRQQIQSEYEWADEQEARRDLQRERERLKWREDDLRFARLRDAAGGGPLPSNARLGGTQAALGTGLLDGAKPAPGSDCEQPPIIVEPYGKFVAETVTQPDYAYVTYVSSSEYVQGAAVLMHSIALTGSQYARSVMVTADVGRKDRELLSTLAQVIEIQRVQHPHYISNAHYRDTFTKLRIWELAMFKKVVYIDVDVVIVRNIDDLFDLSEWSVPMDAEQSRYSTGMMVCEPKLTTFDDMMGKLQTTRVSMELPDLLFLKEYFDAVHASQRSATPPPSHSYYYAPKTAAPQQRINIIPRWYQVYQEEFGSQYHTYLTGRKQRITIYDRRIHGIHYPGNNKPWNQFAVHWAKFKPFFCHWSDAEMFVYEPKFMWYVHFAWMKSTLRRASSGVSFDFETGANQIVLSEYVSGKRAPPATPKPPPHQYSGYDYNSEDYDPRPTPNSNQHSSFRSPNFANSKLNSNDDGATSQPKPTASSSEVWVPARCVVRRRVLRGAALASANAAAVTGSTTQPPATTAGRPTTTGAKTGATTIAGETLGSGSGDASGWDWGSSSGGSASTGRQLQQIFKPLQDDDPPAGDSGSGDVASDTNGPSSAGSDASALDGGFEPWPTAAAATPAPAQNDVVLDLSTLEPFAARLPQAWSGVDLEPYTWVVTWCTPRKLHAAHDSTCGLDAYVAQYSGGMCRSNFAEQFSMHLLTRPANKGAVEVLGVVLRSSVVLTFPPRRKVIEVVVRCDWSLGETEAKLDMHENASRVNVDSVRLPHDRRYTLRLRSRCACVGGCGEAKALLKNAPAGVTTRAPTVDKAAVAMWALSTFGSGNEPFPRGSAFGACIGASVSDCLEAPGCEYLVSKQKCQPAVGTEWVHFRKAATDEFCDCSHVGGNAEDVVTLEQCQEKAKEAKANVINYNPWPKGVAAGTKLTRAPADKSPVVGGCYFKQCTAKQLYQGRPSVKKAMEKDEVGFEVYFLNPLHMDDADAALYDRQGH
jgi:hypothetical protein